MIFKCPECEHDVVCRSLVGVTAAELCSVVENDTLDYFEMETYFDFAKVAGYYCDACGFRIDVNNDEELVEWVKEELRTRGTDSGMGNVKYVIHNNKVVKFKITANISMKLEK